MTTNNAKSATRDVLVAICRDGRRRREMSVTEMLLMLVYTGRHAESTREREEIAALCSDLSTVLKWCEPLPSAGPRCFRRARLVCDAGCEGVLFVDRLRIDISTTGATDVVCNRCHGPMVAEVDR